MDCKFVAAERVDELVLSFQGDNLEVIAKHFATLSKLNALKTIDVAAVTIASS